MLQLSRSLHIISAPIYFDAIQCTSSRNEETNHSPWYYITYIEFVDLVPSAEILPPINKLQKMPVVGQMVKPIAA